VATALGLAAPFLLAALGETVGQRSGVINLGVDGIMLLSAFATYFVALKTSNLFFAILAGMGVGALMGVVTAFISVTLKAEQGISGIGVYLFGLGFSDLLFIKFVGTPLPINTLNPINIPLLDRIPAIGGMFFKQTILVYIAFLLVPVVTFVLNRTTFGMKIRAAGENPAAADSVGVNVVRIRWKAVLIGCVLAGLAGAALLMFDGIFQENLTQSEGFIAVALVYFGAWRPTGVMGGSLLYGLAIAVVLEWKSLGIIPLSASDLWATAPAVITILALLTVARRFRQPAALGKPYERGG
jgi:simple sugar transport system permease protein